MAGERLTVSGMRDGEPLIQFRATWYCSTLLDADWDLQETVGASGWPATRPSTSASASRFAIEDYAQFSPGLTAHRPVNSVAAVCAAAPSIRVDVRPPPSHREVSLLADGSPLGMRRPFVSVARLSA